MSKNAIFSVAEERIPFNSTHLKILFLFCHIVFIFGSGYGYLLLLCMYFSLEMGNDSLFIFVIVQLSSLGKSRSYVLKSSSSILYQLYFSKYALRPFKPSFRL